MPISLILDVIISVLLVLTIAYAMRLNQRLSQLRSDKNELLQLAKTFADATIRAESSIKQLKISSEVLGAEVDKAEALKDDLSYLVERGGRTADEMVDSVRGIGPETMVKSGRDTPGRDTSGRSKASGRNKTSDRGGRSSEKSFEDSRLIEDAIRAAGMPTNEKGPQEIRRVKSPRSSKTTRLSESLNASESTRRITGRLGALAKNPTSDEPQSDRALFDRTERDHPEPDLSTFASSRDLGGDDEGAIGDTKAARELLKALGTLK